MKIVSRDQWFEVKQLSDGIRLIHEPYIRPFYRCNLWHIQGRDKDLLLDSGSGLVSLREQLPWITERPLVAVASHCHFDHIAGHHEFAERLVHPAEARHPGRTGRRKRLEHRHSSATTCSRLTPIARCATPNIGSRPHRPRG